MTNNDILKKGRDIIDKHNKNILIKGISSISDEHSLKNDLLNIGFESKEEFLDFNIKQNLQEIDKCYIPVFLNNEKIALCTMDKCLFNSPSCYNFINNKNKKNYIMIQKQLEEAHKENLLINNINLFKTPEQYLYFQEFDGNSPRYCLFEFIKIKEPAFNVLWGTDEYKKIGNDIQQKIDNEFINNKNIFWNKERNTYFIINKRTSEYFILKNELLNKNWKIKYPISKNTNWKDIFIYKQSDLKRTSNGIFYKTQFTPINQTIIYLFIFIDMVSYIDIEIAKKEIYKKYNVIYTNIIRLKRKY